MLGAKTIIDIHDVLPEFYTSKFSRGKKGTFFKLLALVEKISCGFADHVIIANHIWEKKLVDRSVKPSKITTLINYPDTSIFYPRNRIREDSVFKMLYPGTVSWHQGLDIAMRALALIKDKVPQVAFYIYGGGPKMGEIVQLVDQLDLHGRVFFDPGKRLLEMAKIIADADLGVVPKRNDQFGGEAFSTKTMEFMASGVPIIVAKTKVDQYYFNESLVKFFQPESVEDLADAMLKMVRDKSLRDRLSKNGLEFVRKNTWGEKKEEYLRLVYSLCGKTAG
jgi:glycosyltransferase involved in cell wall biosynthesis